MADLVAAGITKSFGRTLVLADVDLRVASGTLTALLGASGSGKTTLLRLICGFERPDAGSIDLDGRPVAGPRLHLPAERRRIGYVAQDGALFPHLSVADNVAFGLPRRERTAATVDRLLALVGLRATYAVRRPHQLSGGEQQRVALARALAAQPRIVLLDEPFSSLDAALRGETRQAVADAIAQTRATALLVTHDQGEALSMGAQVAVLRDGRMLQVGTPEAVYRRPNDVDLARFLGEAVVLPGESAAGRVTCALGDLPLAAGMPSGAVEVMIRPEQIRLLAENEPGGLPAEVGGATFFGHDARVALVSLDPASTRFTTRLPGHVPAKAGDRVRFAVAGEVVAYARSQPAAMATSEPAASREPATATTRRSVTASQQRRILCQPI